MKTKVWLASSVAVVVGAIFAVVASRLPFPNIFFTPEEHGIPVPLPSLFVVGGVLLGALVGATLHVSALGSGRPHPSKLVLAAVIVAVGISLSYPILMRSLFSVGVMLLLPGIIIGAAGCLAVLVATRRWRTGPAVLLVGGAVLAPYLTLALAAVFGSLWQPYMPILFWSTIQAVAWWSFGG